MSADRRPLSSGSVIVPIAEGAASADREDARVGSMPELSIIVPCRNEVRRVDDFVSRLTACADASVGAARWEMLVVDDASTDDTAARVSHHATHDPRVALLRPAVGAGKGAAVRAGLLAARGRLSFVTDADLAGQPEQLAAAIAALGTEAVALTGSRTLPGAVVQPARPLGRRLPAAIFRGGARVALAVAASDPQCGFKLFRTAAVRPAAEQLFTDGFAYELELLRRIADDGGAVVDFPIRWTGGEGSSVRVVTDGLMMARDVVRIRRRLRRERRAGTAVARRAIATVGNTTGAPCTPVVGSGAAAVAECAANAATVGGAVHDAGAREPGRSVVGDGRRPGLSVVMPLYNELAVIDGVLDELAERVLDLPAVVAAGGAEVIVVDDRGTDGSADRVRARAMVDARIELLVNDVNVGHGRSVLAGLDHAHGEWLLQLDSDGQVDLAGFATLWAGRDDADLWYAERHDRDDPRVRLVLTRFVNALVSVLAGQRIIDANAGYKLLRRSLYRHLRTAIPSDTFAPSLLFVIGGLRVRARVRPFTVAHRPRRAGPSSLDLRRLGAAVKLATRQTIRYAAIVQRRYDSGDERCVVPAVAVPAPPTP